MPVDGLKGYEDDNDQSLYLLTSVRGGEQWK